jgi:hypothetical protein
MVLEFQASSVDVSTATSFQAYIERYGAQPERYWETRATVAQPVKAEDRLPPQ